MSAEQMTKIDQDVSFFVPPKGRTQHIYISPEENLYYVLVQNVVSDHFKLYMSEDYRWVDYSMPALLEFHVDKNAPKPDCYAVIRPFMRQFTPVKIRELGPPVLTNAENYLKKNPYISGIKTNPSGLEKIRSKFYKEDEVKKALRRETKVAIGSGSLVTFGEVNGNHVSVFAHGDNQNTLSVYRTKSNIAECISGEVQFDDNLDPMFAMSILPSGDQNINVGKISYGAVRNFIYSLEKMFSENSKTKNQSFESAIKMAEDKLVERCPFAEVHFFRKRIASHYSMKPESYKDRGLSKNRRGTEGEIDFNIPINDGLELLDQNGYIKIKDISGNSKRYKIVHPDEAVTSSGIVLITFPSSGSGKMGGYKVVKERANGSQSGGKTYVYKTEDGVLKGLLPDLDKNKVLKIKDSPSHGDFMEIMRSISDPEQAKKRIRYSSFRSGDLLLKHIQTQGIPSASPQIDHVSNLNKFRCLSQETINSQFEKGNFVVNDLMDIQNTIKNGVLLFRYNCYGADPGRCEFERLNWNHSSNRYSKYADYIGTIQYPRFFADYGSSGKGITTFLGEAVLDVISVRDLIRETGGVGGSKCLPEDCNYMSGMGVNGLKELIFSSLGVMVDNNDNILDKKIKSSTSPFVVDNQNTPKFRRVYAKAYEIMELEDSKLGKMPSNLGESEKNTWKKERGQLLEEALHRNDYKQKLLQYLNFDGFSSEEAEELADSCLRDFSKLYFDPKGLSAPITGIILNERHTDKETNQLFDLISSSELSKIYSFGRVNCDRSALAQECPKGAYVVDSTNLKRFLEVNSLCVENGVLCNRNVEVETAELNLNDPSIQSRRANLFSLLRSDNITFAVDNDDAGRQLIKTVSPILELFSIPYSTVNYDSFKNEKTDVNDILVKYRQGSLPATFRVNDFFLLKRSSQLLNQHKAALNNRPSR